jgi:hypothetical protein
VSQKEIAALDPAHAAYVYTQNQRHVRAARGSEGDSADCGYSLPIPRACWE